MAQTILLSTAVTLVCAYLATLIARASNHNPKSLPFAFVCMVAAGLGSYLLGLQHPFFLIPFIGACVCAWLFDEVLPSRLTFGFVAKS